MMLTGVSLYITVLAAVYVYTDYKVGQKRTSVPGAFLAAAV